MAEDLEVLISALGKDAQALASGMNLECDAVLVDQGSRNDRYEFNTSEGHTVRTIESVERGIGRSRNLALEEARGRIVLFSDDDIVYSEGYAERIQKAFEAHPEADIIMFNVNVSEDRKTYRIDKEIRVHKWSVGRYPAYAAAARLDSIRRAKVRFSLLFGGGARYSNGEDSLFFMDCLRAGLKVIAVPVTIGSEIPRESTWFHGFNDKFFLDRGVLYSFLYGNAAGIWALRFVIAKRHSYAGQMKPSDAFKLMRKGIKEGKAVRDEQE